MRKAIVIMLLAATSFACSTATESPEDALIHVNPPPAVDHPLFSGQPDRWDTDTLAIARKAFFQGYGEPDAFGDCVFNWIVSKYLPSEINEDLDQDELIAAATNVCAHHIN